MQASLEWIELHLARREALQERIQADLSGHLPRPPGGAATDPTRPR